MTDSLPTGDAALPEERMLELQELIEACVGDSATPEQIAQLDRWLSEDAAGPQFLRAIHPTAVRTEKVGLVSAPQAQPAKSPVLGFLGGVVDYVGNSRMLMFWLMFAALGIYFAAHYGVVLLNRFWAQQNAQLAAERRRRAASRQFEFERADGSPEPACWKSRGPADKRLRLQVDARRIARSLAPCRSH